VSPSVAGEGRSLTQSQSDRNVHATRSSRRRTTRAAPPLVYGKVSCLAVVGDEDGAHPVTAGVFQPLNDVLFTQPVAG
jgi:hypothetical protein